MVNISFFVEDVLWQDVVAIWPEEEVVSQTISERESSSFHIVYC